LFKGKFYVTLQRLPNFTYVWGFLVWTPIIGVCSTNECVMHTNLWAYMSFKYRVVRNLPEAEFWRKNNLLSDRLTVPLSVTYIHTHLERYLVLTFEYC